MSEIEAKFLIEDSSQIDGLIALLRTNGLEVRELPVVDVDDRYLDTRDWRVFQAGWSYRWRESNGARKAGLKSVGLNGDVIHKREEVEQEVAAFPANGCRVPRGPLAEALGHVRRADLRELFRVRNRRRLFAVRNGEGATIELAIDRATITATIKPVKPAPGHLEFDELEIELKDGPEDSLRQLAHVIREQCGLLPSRLSKFERGLQAIGRSPQPARMKREVRLLEEADFVRDLQARHLRKKAPVTRLAYRFLLEQFEELICRESQAWEGLEPEGVHQARVATRRIRAALRAFKQVLPAPPVKQFNQEFKWVADRLGDVRDLDVYREDFRGYVSEIPEEEGTYLNNYRQHLTDRWREARGELRACLASERYRQLKTDFAEFLRRGPDDDMPAGDKMTIRRAAKRFIGKQYQRVIRDGRSISSASPDEALHELRIDCKRLRYLFEFFQPTYGKSLAPFIKRLKRLQDVLGEFQDACVATQRLRQYAGAVPLVPENREELIVLGQLIGSQRRRAIDRRAGFHDHWERFDRTGRRRQILAILQ
jgi:CHAD domain-containing protein